MRRASAKHFARGDLCDGDPYGREIACLTLVAQVLLPTARRMESGGHWSLILPPSDQTGVSFPSGQDYSEQQPRPKQLVVG